MNMSDDKDSDERDKISNNDEEKMTDVIEVLKPENWVCRKIWTMLRKIRWKKSDEYEWWEGIWWNISDN